MASTEYLAEREVNVELTADQFTQEEQESSSLAFSSGMGPSRPVGATATRGNSASGSDLGARGGIPARCRFGESSAGD